MKTMKKLSALLLVGVLTLAMSVSAFAAEPEMATTPVEDEATLSEDAEDNTQSRASNVPSSSHDLPYQATVTDLCEDCGTYTKYYFHTSTKKFTIGGTLSSSGDQNTKSRKAKIELYEVGSNTCVDSYPVPEFTGSTTLNHTFQNLDPNKNYYFRIRNTTGWGIWKNLWISGSVDINE